MKLDEALELMLRVCPEICNAKLFQVRLAFADECDSPSLLPAFSLESLSSEGVRAEVGHVPEEEDLPHEDTVGDEHGSSLCIELGDGAPSANSQNDPEKLKLAVVEHLQGLSVHADENLTVVQQHTDDSTLPYEEGCGDRSDSLSSLVINYGSDIIDETRGQAYSLFNGGIN